MWCKALSRLRRLESPDELKIAHTSFEETLGSMLFQILKTDFPRLKFIISSRNFDPKISKFCLASTPKNPKFFQWGSKSEIFKNRKIEVLGHFSHFWSLKKFSITPDKKVPFKQICLENGKKQPNFPKKSNNGFNPN